MRTVPPIVYVGFVGTHGSGKTTAADNLAEYLGGYTQLVPHRVNMADALRDVVSKVWPYRPDAQKNHPLEREVLQATGELWRLVDRNIWLRRAMEEMKRLAEETWETDPQAAGVVMIAADTYNWNEIFTLDQVFAVRNREVDISPAMDGYVPETIEQTNYFLRNASLVAPLLSGHLDYQLVSAPQEYSDWANVERLGHIVLERVNEKRVALGLDPVTEGLLEEPTEFYRKEQLPPYVEKVDTSSVTHVVPRPL